MFSFLSLMELTRFSILSFVLWSFQVLGKDLMDYGTKIGKSLSLGCPLHPKVKFKDNQKPKLGYAPEGIPLSSSSIGNFTWSYIFIHHMICVLLGASFSFASFCLMLVRIMFCIFSVNKKSRIAFAMLILLVYMLLFENRKFTAVHKFPRKVRKWYNVEYFCILRSNKFITVGILVHNFWSQGSIDTLAFFKDYTVLADFCYVCIVCICLLV